MKIKSQDSQFDAAFDAQCREMLSKRSVDAPPMANSTLPEPRKERKLAWVAGAVVLMGVCFGLWNKGEDTRSSDSEATAPASLVEYASESPAVAAEGTHTELPVAASNQEALKEGNEVTPENEPQIAKEEGLNSELTEGAVGHAVESVRLVPVPNKSGLSATDLHAEPAENSLGSKGTETSLFSVSPTQKERAYEMDNSVPAAVDSPVENTEPSSAPDGNEPVLRLPLTLPSGGGR